MKNSLISGHRHPNSIMIDLIVNYFKKYNFDVALGPEIESEWYNFDFLRVPKNHPARDIQDTFWIDETTVLRTHTSTLQGRVADYWKIKPPLRVIAPGRVFRNEATDSSHDAVFYQIDGFVVDKNINMSHLVGTIDNLLKYLFKNIETKFYPHHYPFVEPGMDVAMKWNGKWLEILGCGMIHSEVIRNMHLDPNEWQGFAFGVGLDRFTLLKTGIKDIRSLYRPDLRITYQF